MTAFDYPVGPPVAPAPARAPQRVDLSGRYVRIEPLSALRHGDDLFAAAGGEKRKDLWTYMGDGPFATRAAFEENIRAKEASNDPLFFALIDLETDVCGGHAALMRIDRANRVIEIGNIMLGPALQRTRAATEAMRLMAAYAFETLGYRRYEWKCNDLNAPSKRAALRLGFTYEGVFRQHMIVKGRNRDTAWFSMLDSEWPARRQSFETWLAPENFDAQGRQKVSLGALNGIGDA